MVFTFFTGGQITISSCCNVYVGNVYCAVESFCFRHPDNPSFLYGPGKLDKLQSVEQLGEIRSGLLQFSFGANYNLETPSSDES